MTEVTERQVVDSIGAIRDSENPAGESSVFHIVVDCVLHSGPIILLSVGGYKNRDECYKVVHLYFI